VCNLLVYVNHSINFFLYCMTGGRFRHEFVVAVREWARCRSGKKSANGQNLSKVSRTFCVAKGKSDTEDNISGDTTFRSSPIRTKTESIA